jgi:hypothetical protein
MPLISEKPSLISRAPLNHGLDVMKDLEMCLSAKHKKKSCDGKNGAKRCT